MNTALTPIAAAFQPSPQQSDFFDWIVNGTGSCILEAVAGAGKTTTLVKGLEILTGKAFFGAFSKDIVSEIRTKVAHLGRKVTVNTMHAMYEEWAETEPTIIVCQGGNVAMLTDLFARLKPLAVALNIPCVKFHEDEQSLGGVITSVAVLVPDTLFDVDVVMETDTTQTPTKFGQRVQHFVTKDGLHTYKPGHIQHDFLSIVKNARLA